MIRTAAALLIGCGSPCLADDTGAIWTLAEISGAAFAASATLTFAEDGKIVGRAPCNRYGAQLLDGGTTFEVGPIMATKMACPDLPAETLFFGTLVQMSTSEMREGLLILRGADGAEMVFRPAE